MALINCPECGKHEISDTPGTICPSCGFNVNNNREIYLKNNQSTQVEIFFAMTLSAFVAYFVLTAVTMGAGDYFGIFLTWFTFITIIILFNQKNGYKINKFNKYYFYLLSLSPLILTGYVFIKIL